MARTSTAVDETTQTLGTLLVCTLVMGYHFAVVPDSMAREAGMPEDDHPSNWIPRLDGRRPACGEAQRLVKVHASLWCLKPALHRGDHW